MLITIIAGGLSVLAVLVSVLFAWLASRTAERTRAAAWSVSADGSEGRSECNG